MEKAGGFDESQNISGKKNAEKADTGRTRAFLARKEHKSVSEIN